jgi:hypothetical protein
MSPCDESIGPRVEQSCRSFDFTLSFQDLYFSIVPYAALLVLVALPIARLLRAPNVIKRTKLVAIKGVSRSVPPRPISHAYTDTIPFRRLCILCF